MSLPAPPRPLIPHQAPGGLPLLGHAVAMQRRRLDLLEEVQRLDAGLVALRLGPQRMLMATDHHLVRELLVQRADDFGPSPQYRLMEQVTGRGLLLSEGAFHRRQRRLIRPAFRHARVRHYAELMTDLSRTWTEGLHEGRVVAMDEEFGNLASSIVVRSLFTQGITGQDATSVVEAMTDVMAWVGARGSDPLPFLAKLPTRVNRRFARGSRTLHTLVDAVIAHRHGLGAEAPDDVLTWLLETTDAETGERMSDGQVHDEVMTLLTAGTETTSRTLAWCLYLLARHPEAEERLHAEVDAVLAGRAAGFDDLPHLPYTRRVLTETLRLYPSGYLLSRASVRDTALGPYAVPAGTTVLFSPYSLHRDPRLFPRPERFLPDRWLPEHTSEVTPEAFLPFGLGQHGCLGEGFAWTEMTIALATLTGRWRLRPLSDAAVTPTPLFSLACGRMRMRVERRAGVVPPAKGGAESGA
ncbi:cytochrome P450 [Streptomyces sp. NPDC051079]|uniref:cytochrome P450 n=1 Tax=Streptomyces sp. NPDC051079 TaxID=3155043 RepID=UPI0034500061